ncbi:hypothetical protein FQR65_LT02114 [Abscondita terminalis]|nr:hypothetical protein FQR65_LT02114 [Abscondita terminalis]
MCQERVPFGIAEVVNANDEEFGFDQHFNERSTILQTTMFVSPTLSTQFFHQWQRQRRTWWRKFSASPGKYVFSDLHIDDDGNQQLKVNADYSWERPLVEFLRFFKTKHPCLTIEHLNTRDGRKKVTAHYVTSTISLPTMLLNTLCDAYDEPEFQGKPRPLLRLHRKLAPYKISFAVTAPQSSTTEELGSLALYLCKQLRAEHISSLLLPTATRHTLDLQWNQYDQLGIPYTVVLNEGTLKNGISLLRSRDTTLKEQVHVTKLPAYVQKLFKNY